MHVNWTKSKRGLLIFLMTLIGLMSLNYSVLFFLNAKNLFYWTREDGFVEYFGAILYLGATIIAASAFFQSSKTGGNYPFKMKRNYFYLLLALLFFFCFGEEISWGQRIFHVKTPDYISEVNAQQEINIHNLNVFHGRDEANQRKSGIEVWYSLARIFSLFWFTYCFLIPLIYRYIRKASVFLNWLALPIPSIWLGILMIVNYGFPKAIENNHSYWINRAATEIKEANLALLFLAVIWILYWNDRHKLRQNSVST